jgi:two-component sensor histidine kinase
VVNELSHRVTNTLASVAVVARRTASDAVQSMGDHDRHR